MGSAKDEARDGLTPAEQLAVTKHGGRFDPVTGDLLDEGGGALVSESLPHAHTNKPGDRPGTKEEEQHEL